MRIAVASWLMFAAVGAAWPCIAQPAVQNVPPDVVVQGRRDHQDAAHRFVNEITVEKEDQVAQFGEPICPLAIGLPAAYNAAIQQRVREDAHAAGVRVAADRCEPNVIIMISDNGHKLLDRLHKDRGPMFEGMELHDLHALLDATGPVHAWQGVELLDNGGYPIGLCDPNNAGCKPPTARGYMPSRLQQAFSRRIDTAFVVIDADAIDGLTLTQIADYAAMRALAITHDPKGASMAQDSILTLFDTAQASAKPASLSRSDAAYLHALYATSSLVLGSTQRSNMAQSINRALSSAPSSDK